jgi:hypothetical protein
MLLRGCPVRKGAEVPAPSCPGVWLARVEPILARCKLPDHGGVLRSLPAGERPNDRTALINRLVITSIKTATRKAATRVPWRPFSSHPSRMPPSHWNGRGKMRGYPRPDVPAEEELLAAARGERTRQHVGGTTKGDHGSSASWICKDQNGEGSRACRELRVTDSAGRRTMVLRI